MMDPEAIDAVALAIKRARAPGQSREEWFRSAARAALGAMEPFIEDRVREARADGAWEALDRLD